MENVEFLNELGKINNRLRKLIEEIKVSIPEKELNIDLSFYSTDRKNYPGSPIGVSWQINIDEKNKEGDDYFTFEILNESNLWMLDGFVSKHLDLELIEKFVEIEEEDLETILSKMDGLLTVFKVHCLSYLKNVNSA